MTLKKAFLINFKIIELKDTVQVIEKFNSETAFKINIGSTFSSKPDKHFNSDYKVLDIDKNAGNLKIEYIKKSDRRSFGGKLVTSTGTFYVAYK